MATFLTDLIKKSYTQDEIFAVIFESERGRKRRRMQAIVIGTVGAHRLKKMKELLTFEKLATWRRMNGFDRIAADDNLWASRQLPLTPEQFTQNLWCEVNALKDAISMPATEDTVTRPWQETIDFVDGLKGNFPDEELAVIERYVEKRSREAAQGEVTVTPLDTAQHRCSPCPLDPEPDACVNLENNERGWTQSWRSSNHHRWYGSRNARTAVSPERGDMGDWTNYRLRHLDHGRGFKPKGKYFVTNNGKRGQTSEGHGNY